MNPSSRNAIIAGNWKMHYGPKQAAHFAQEIVPVLDQVVERSPQIVTVLCPPAISLAAVREVLLAQPFPQIERRVDPDGGEQTIRACSPPYCLTLPATT